MEQIKVNTSTNTYSIYTGENIRYKISDLLPKHYSTVFIVTDDKVADLYLDDVRNSFSSEQRVFHSTIPAGEGSKNINTFYKLHTDAVNCGLDRQSLIIALGGGVVGDVAGFVAATYMRGIDYIQIPTTILAHDSSVGGKVAINHELGKNMIGSFYPPVAVIYDIQSLKTLDNKEVRSGYAELVKEALIKDDAFFQMIMKTDLQEITNEFLESQLRSGIKIKAAIVEEDEKESGVRMYLNLGHTLGHALEAELGYGTLTHGEAVAIGTLFAIRVSESVFSNVLPYDQLYSWLRDNGYPLQLSQVSIDRLMQRMKSDKKVLNGKIQMVLLRQIADPTVMEVDDQELKLVLKSFIGELVGN